MSAIVEQEDGSCWLQIHVQPGASRTELVGEHGGRLKIRLAAPPVEGRANACLVEAVADWLQLARREVAMESGAGSRFKRLRVRLPASEIRGRLEARWPGAHDLAQ